ncbi:MAG: HNH endonuclease [Phycisphaerae bacterium]|nr:HNH endonuclease [Phycisphaerae bacterium]
MIERRCDNCVFAMAVRNAERRTFICVSREESLGEPTQVRPADCCPRFQAKPAPASRLEQADPPDDKTSLIPLTRNKAALVDLADFVWLSEFKWRAMRVGGKFYACRTEKGRTVLMHRRIMNPPEGMVVDHKNDNGLDNRRINLRICTQAQNRYNSRPRAGRSGYKGVYPQGDKWYGLVEHKGRQHYVGSFATPVEAARARDRKAIQLFGEFAWLNFPTESRLVGLHGSIRLRIRIRASLRKIHHRVTEHTETEEPPTGN